MVCARGGVVGKVFGVVCANRLQEAKAGDCWVVGGMEWPLNIVFRRGSSEDNAVAWRG